MGLDLTAFPASSNAAKEHIVANDANVRLVQKHQRATTLPSTRNAGEIIAHENGGGGGTDPDQLIYRDGGPASPVDRKICLHRLDEDLEGQSQQLKECRAQNVSSLVSPASAVIGQHEFHTTLNQPAWGRTSDNVLGAICPVDGSEKGTFYKDIPLPFGEVAEGPSTNPSIATKMGQSGYRFVNGTSEQLQWMVRVPHGWDALTNPLIVIEGIVEQAESAGDDVDFRVAWASIVLGAAVDKTADETANGTVDLGGSPVDGQRFTCSVPLDLTAPTPDLGRGDWIRVLLSRAALGEVGNVIAVNVIARFAVHNYHAFE